jgi:hypothetical protein
VTDYQGLAVANPLWRRAVFWLGCGALLLLGALGAAVLLLVSHARAEHPAQAPAAVDGGTRR